VWLKGAVAVPQQNAYGVVVVVRDQNVRDPIKIDVCYCKTVGETADRIANLRLEGAVAISQKYRDGLV
jgi:hypothetical protein